MAERDTRRPGANPNAPQDAERPAGQRPDQRGGDAEPLDAWGRGPPPQPGRGQPGLSWSNLADLDESAPEAPGGQGVGPVEGTGGLLGVDSGLLRVIESDERKPAGGAAAGGAFPSEFPEPSRAPATRPPEPSRAPPRPQPVRPPAPPPEPEEAGPVAPDAAEGANWVKSVFGGLEVEAEESGMWLDSVISQAAIDEAAAPWGEVDVETFEPPADDYPEPTPPPAPPPAPDTFANPPARPRAPAPPSQDAFAPPAPRQPASRAVWADDVEQGERVPDDLGGEGLLDAWGAEGDDPASGWGPPSVDSVRSLAPMAPPDPLRELDPFAAPVGAGLQDELGGDPFDSLSIDTAAFRPPGDARPSRPMITVSAPVVAAEPEPALEPAFEDDDHPPTLRPSGLPQDAWPEFVGQEGVAESWSAATPLPAEPAMRVTGPLPTTRPAPAAAPEPAPLPPIDPEALQAARELLEARSAARLAEAADAIAGLDAIAVEEILADGDDRRVVRIEHTSVGELQVDAEPADVTSAAPGPESVGRRSVLEQWGEEPLELDAPSDPRGGRARPPPADDDDAFVFEIRDSRPSAKPDAGSVAADPWAPPEDADTSIAPERPAPPPDRLALERLGLPLLGIVPTFEPAPRMEAFPPGSLGLREPVTPVGPAVVPELSLPDPFDLDDPGHRLLATLQAELLACDERRRLALLLHAFGRVAQNVVGNETLAREAFRAALVNDPSLQLDRWAVLDDLDARGETEELVAMLARAGSGTSPDADALYRAGHVAAARLQDASRALALWQRGAETSLSPAGPMLARYAMQLSQLDWEGADATLSSLSGQLDGPVLSTLVLLDRLRLADELRLPDSVQQGYVRAAQERMGGTPAVQAALERFVATHGDMELLLSGLRGHFDSVSADFQRGQLSESAAKRAVGEIFYKAAWALERLGRRTDALREYQNALQSLPNDPYLLHRAGELARRLGKADEHRTHLERVAALARDPAEAANALYQMGLIAQTVLADEALAARDFERALAALPTFTPALAALGRQAMRQGRWGDVRQRFETEIAQLEESLNKPLAQEVRERTIRGVLTRYYRVARVLEQQLAEPDTALVYHKRALALSPRFLPAFLAIERTYEQTGRWRELVALYRGLVDRAAGSDIDPGPLLTRAAEVLQSRLGDDRNAARAYARVLASQPDDRRVLERASEIFARLGNRAAVVEVELRRAGTSPNARQKARHLLRAAEMQALDGDPLLAAAEALPIFRSAWDAEPGNAGAFDGVVRAAAMLGRAAEVGHLVARLQDIPPLDAALLAQAADLLLAAGRNEEALGALDAWRRASRDSDLVTPLRILALERAQSWRPLVDALEELLHQTPDARRRSGLLARIGEIHEFRIREPEPALDAYQRALALDPTCQSARDGSMRLVIAGHDSMLSVATRSVVSGLFAAREAALNGNVLEMSAHVERLAPHALDERTAAAVHRISQGAALEDELVQFAFEGAPERLDFFEAWLARLEGPQRRAERIDAYWRRLPFEEGAQQPALLASLVALCEAARDEDGLTKAADALLSLDPASLIAPLALRRQARRMGQALAAFEAGERVAGLLQSPHLAAETYRTLAEEAVSLPVAAARARGLLEQAVLLDPGDRAATSALEQRLREEQDWGELLGLYNRRIVAGLTRDEAHALYLAKARLLGGPLDQPDEAVATLRGFVEQFSEDAAGVLDAALYARDLRAHDHALTWLELASGADDDDIAAEAGVVRARLLREFGDAAGARRELERLVARVPRCAPALELLSEVLAAARDWQAVVRVLRRLFDLETRPVQRAERACGIGEILSRVKGDARAASGWFKRAIELDPASLHAVWRMLEEADRLPPGEVPVEHMMDAVDRALTEVQDRLADDPFNVDQLRGYAQLQSRRQVWDAAYLARSALEFLGEADSAERAFLTQRRARLVVDFAASLTPAQRQQSLLHDAEHGVAGEVFSTFALVLTDLLSERPPSGATRLSARSFPRWQNDFTQIAQGLGAEDIELWQIGQAPARLTGTYLPSPALIVGADVLAAAVDASLAFRLGHLVEGLHAGRLLFDRNGADRVAAAVRLILEIVAPEAAERVIGTAPLGPELQTRIVDRAQRLPRRLLSNLEARLQAGTDEQLDFASLAAGVAESRARAGFLACGDLGVALESVRTIAAGQYDTRNIRVLEPARALMAFSLTPACIALRKSLGVAVQR